MTKKTFIHRLTLTAALLLLVTGIALVLKAGRRYRDLHTCECLQVHLRDSLGFVSAEDVSKRVSALYGSYIGQKLDSIDLNRIEDIVDAQSAVLKSEAYTTPDGKLHIDVTQREPAIRFQSGATGFYADSRGYIFPLQEHNTFDVPVVDGRLPVHYSAGYKGEPADKAEAAWVLSVMKMMRTLGSSKVWKDRIVQVSVNSDGDLILVPRTGSERFIFGDPLDTEDKLARMEKYYSHIRPAAGEDVYKTVSVKYRGQIICRK